MTEILVLLLGVAFSVSGAMLLYFAWQARRAGQHVRRRRFVVAGWLLITISVLPWVIATGGDKGTALAILVLLLAGSALVIRAGLLHKGNGRRVVERDVRNEVSHGSSLLLRRIWVFLLSGPIAMAAALFISAAVFATWNLANGSEANRLATALLLMPLAWTLLALYATYDAPLRYRTSVVFLFLVVGLAGTFFKGIA